MAQYRKKPVIIEAIKLKFSTDSQDEIIQWSNNTIQKGLDGGLKIPTLEGIMIANTGDYIIKGVKGEFYPCKPDIFEMTYELVNMKQQTADEINKLAEEVYGKGVNQDYEEGFVDGYNKAKETLYTEFDIIKAFEHGWNQRHYGIDDEILLREIQNNLIKSLKQPDEL